MRAQTALSRSFLFSWLLLSPVGARASAQNLILVILDTVRADHVGAYGYTRDTTPNLDSLAKRGVLFSNAYSQSNWTVPAVASLFTGKRPSSHGVFRFSDRLNENETTLAEVFLSHGFRTAAFTGGVANDPPYRLSQGFELSRIFDNSDPGIGQLKDALRPSLQWLEANRSSPFFLWIHGADAHTPYVCPPADRYRYSEPNYAGPARGLEKDLNFLKAFNADDASLDSWQQTTAADWERARRIKSGRRHLEDMIAQYDGCLRYQDSFLAELYAAMDRWDLWKNTTVLILSDHGEELGDHGGYGHAFRPLHEEVLRVPAILYSPDQPESRRGAKIADPIELIDFFPTFMAMQGWPAPDGAEGISLRTTILEGRPAPERGLWSSAAKDLIGPKALDLAAFRLGGWKLLRDGSRWALFDLSRDAGESRDVLDSRAKEAQALASKMLETTAPRKRP